MLLTMKRQRAHHLFSEGMSALRGVEIFAAGTHRGKTYTTNDLDSMVRNFKRSSMGSNPDLRVPAVLGHEENQEFLDRSDLPAAAWCDRLYREGTKLKADFTDVPPRIAQLLVARRYRKVSAEVYDQPPEGVPGQGKMLRRVAFLGGDIPQIKSLEDIPLPEPHSEFARGKAVGVKFTRCIQSAKSTNLWTVFSEVKEMSRDELLQKLQGMGFDMGLITDQIPDEVLAEMIRVADAAGQEPDGDEGDAGDQGDQGDQQMDDSKDTDTDTSSQDATDDTKKADQSMDDSQDTSDDSQKDDMMAQAQKMMDCAKQMMEKYGSKKMAEPRKYSERELNAAVDRAVARALKKHVTGTVGELKKFAEEQVASQKRASVDAFCERMSREGRILPAEKASIHARLMRADSKTCITKFKEKSGRIAELSELDLQMKEIEARPTLFGERFKAPLTGTQSEDAEIAKVEEHFEQFSEGFNRVGTTREKLVAGFKAARKHTPNLTAAEYLA